MVYGLEIYCRTGLKIEMLKGCIQALELRSRLMIGLP